ncbi:MAG: Ig-like domain-containing protein [Candidatus Hodarchaeales archaeon]
MAPDYVNITILTLDENNQTTIELNEVDPLDITYTDGKLYDYTAQEGSSEFFTGIGTHKFYYNCSDGLTSIRYPSDASEFFTFEIIDREPTLSDETVTDPVEAGSGQDIVFTINYTHSYNSSPDYIWLTVYTIAGDSSFTAQISNIGNEVNTSDQDYTDGKIYRYIVSEGSIAEFTEVGIHKFYFRAKDSDLESSEIRYPENTSEYFTFEIVDYQPTLSDEIVTNPVLSGTGQYITFTINYTHQNNVAPDYIWLTVYTVAGDSSFTAQISNIGNEVNTSDQDYTDGKIYRYIVQEGSISEFTGIGTHNFYFRAEDADGVTSVIRYPTSGYFTFEIIPAPTVQIVSPNATIYTTETVSVELSGSAEHYWYYIEGVDSTNQTWTAPVFRTLTDGTYTLHAYGNNSIGNITHTSVIFTIDTTAPYVNIDSPTASSYTIDTISVELSGDAEHYWYFIEGVDSTNQTWIASVDRTLNDSTYTLHAYGNDSAGNEAHVTVEFTVDTTGPTIAIDSPTASNYTTDTISIELSGNAEHYWYYIEGVDSVNHSWTITINRTLSEGTYTLWAYGNDSLGNVAFCSVTFTIVTSTTEPSTETTETSTTSETTTKPSPFLDFFTVLVFLGVVTISTNRFKKR